VAVEHTGSDATIAGQINNESLPGKKLFPCGSEIEVFLDY
jgi:hypothetical protein